MAANSSSRGVTSFGKQFVTHFLSPAPARSLPAAAPALRRSLHASVYDKNIEDQVRPVVVPDDAINPLAQIDWAPNPNTGIFGPSAELNTGGIGADRGYHSSPANAGSESVLEQKTFFRPLEDLDKPQHP